MKIKRIYAVYLRQLILLRHNPTRFFNIFVWIVLDVLLWGFITKYLNVAGNASFSFVPILLGAVVFWDFLIRVQQGVMLAFFEDTWSRNFLNLFCSPLTVAEYVAGLILTSITTSSAALLLMLALAGFTFGYTVFALGFYFIWFIMILFLFGLALGVFATGIVLRLGPSAEWLAWPIPFMLSPFIGIYYPISTLPAALQIVAKLIPPSYVFEGMRSVLHTGSVSASFLLIGTMLAILYLFLAYLFFVYIYRSVLRSGLISRFSAESM